MIIERYLQQADEFIQNRLAGMSDINRLQM
jgi:hypothetical protein